MHLPEPQSVTFSSLISQIENGTVKIPQFQRSFVWTRQQSARLIDSIIKGYPIGTFILWRTVERLRSIRDIGGIALPTPGKGEPLSYVLDGQQRMTSLFVSLKALHVQLDDEIRDYGKMYIKLVGPEDQELVQIEEEPEDSRDFILLSRLLEGDFQYLGSFPPAQQERIKTYKNRIESYQFSIIQVKDAPIDVATEIFTRLNIGGRALTVFEIMVAKTYDHELKFDLLEKVTAIQNQLIDSDFGPIPHATILQAASACLARDISTKAILRLPKKEFIQRWPEIESALFDAVEHLRASYSIFVSRLLPFPALVAVFTYFFYRIKDERPSAQQRRLLKDFFWRVSLGGRYSQSLESHVTKDLKKVDHFINGQPAKYDWPVDVSPGFIENNGYFNAGRSFIKALLCQLASHAPQSFDSGNPVRLKNDWLKRVNSKNYHHFFPRAYMNKLKDSEDFYVNHIANITFVDDYLNKQVIQAKAPSLYLKLFKKENHDVDLGKVLKTHLINLERDAVLEDDFDTFFDHRVKALSRELKKHLIPQDVDRNPTVLVEDQVPENEPADEE
jgi:hypothetical protein